MEVVVEVAKVAAKEEMNLVKVVKVLLSVEDKVQVAAPVPALVLMETARTYFD